MDFAADAVAAAWFVTLFFGAPLLGWALLVLDIRAYYRKLRRALVLVSQYRFDTPLWAIRQRPECLQELGIELGATRDEVMAAYRRRVKHVHPDRGGDRRRFERLQRSLAEALALCDE